jgi:DNA-binding GntR family transcriptional regulator
MINMVLRFDRSQAGERTLSEFQVPERDKFRRPARLGEEVYNTLYAQLISNKIPPGARITVDNLVRELGVSQTPIREALSRLEAQGLVIKTHLVGYSAAAQMDPEQLDQLYDLRLLLEPFAAGRAATRVTEDVTRELEKVAASMQASSSGDSGRSYSRFARLDATFHDLIAATSGNDLIHDVLSRQHTHVHLFHLFYHDRVTLEAIDEHGRVLAALRDRDAAAAEAAMREHIEHSRHRFRAAFDE